MSQHKCSNCGQVHLGADSRYSMCACGTRLTEEDVVPSLLARLVQRLRRGGSDS